MVELLIVADDFTGALDTGVQFAKAGAQVLVKLDYHYDPDDIPEDVRVLVVNTESRHLGPGEAFDIVYDVVEKAVGSGIRHIYKKTDSGMRGNIGAELSAALEASGMRELDFIPAFPQMNRLTIGGTVYIDGVPVEESVFGRDPFNPVKRSSVDEIIGLQSDIPVILGRFSEESEEPAIRVYDVTSSVELKGLGEEILEKNGLRLSGGCAGFASVLPKLLGLESGEDREDAAFSEGLLVVNGSVNPITIAQLNNAEADGFLRVRLSPEEKLTEGYWDTEAGQQTLDALEDQMEGMDRIILDTNDLPMSEDTLRHVAKLGISRETMRKRIAFSVGRMAKGLMERGEKKNVMVMGGDTLQSFLAQLGVGQLWPLKELLPGTVLSEFEWNGGFYHLISKSGGFGDSQLIIELFKITS